MAALILSSTRLEPRKAGGKVGRTEEEYLLLPRNQGQRGGVQVRKTGNFPGVEKNQCKGGKNTNSSAVPRGRGARGKGVARCSPPAGKRSVALPETFWGSGVQEMDT